MNQSAAIHEGAVTSDIDALEQMLLRLSWASQRLMARQLDAYHLTVPQLMALRVIRRSASACTMSELADATYQLSATMTGIVDRLEERLLVERRRDLSDRRTLRLSLTEQGEKLLDQVDQQYRARLRRILGVLSPEEGKQLLRFMQLYLETTLAELEGEGNRPEAVANP